MKKLILFLLLAIAACNALNAQTITTIVNVAGSHGFSGDGGPATAAQIEGTPGLCVDLRGNIYIQDYGNNRIRKVNPGGIISTFAGGGSSTADGIPATSASLTLPTEGVITVDGSGNVYFGETHKIRKVDAATGIITTIAGNGSAGFSGDGGPATAATIAYPFGICFDASGNLYIGDYANFRVRKVNTSGIISTYAGSSWGSSGDGGPATAAQFQSPTGVFADVAGNLYVADIYDSRIRKIDTSGVISTYAGSGSSGFGGDGGPATASSVGFYEPSDVSMDSYGNLYIADWHNDRIRMVTPTGIISTFAGGGSSAASGIPATSASLYYTQGVATDIYNNVYIPDEGHYRICRVGNGVPTATADSFSVFVSNFCGGPSIAIIPDHYSSLWRIKTWFGDGNIQFDTFSSGWGTALLNHYYAASGAYSIKHVLYNGSLAIDSIQYTYNYLYCNTFPIGFFYDANGNCSKDSSNEAIGQPLMVEVDSNGIAIDTFPCTSGIYYTAYGTAGDIYGFRVIGTPAGLYATCPSTGIIYDTLATGVYSVPVKNIGFECTSSTAFDLGIFSTGVRTGVHAHTGEIYAENAYCPPVNATITLRHSPKHIFHNALPGPTSITATSITWNISALSSVDALTHLWYHLETPAGYLTPGDTVNSNIVITPDAGDSDTSNNIVVIIDTVRAGYDPNEMSVSPAGCIASGAVPTQLQYGVHFENTGNDTAHNIYVMDTLSNNVDISTMRLVMSSHEMYISKLKDASGHNILKFDFPKINLRDSSHHGECDGAVIFNINTKPGLANGTNIVNRAGIYFDVNPVVMTNTVTNTIGCPAINGVIAVTENKRIDIYPNPAYSELNIKVPEGAYQSYAITNSLGSVLSDGVLTKAITHLNIQLLPAGLYFLNLKDEEGNVVRKFVKW